MLHALLLEFEGVLADTLALRRAALQRALAEDGVTLSAGQFDGACRGLATRDAAAAAVTAAGGALDDTALDLAALRAERYFTQGSAKGMSLASGAAELVTQAASQVPVGIVTRASRRDVDFVLALAGLEHAFSCIVAAEDAPRGKPAPDGYARALRRLSSRGVRAASTLALEDGAAGIRAARAAGLRCIAVGDLPAHEALLADALLPSLAAETLTSLASRLRAPRERVP